jgi:hypothetical protein
MAKAKPDNRSDDSWVWVPFVFVPALLGAIIGSYAPGVTYTRAAAVGGLIGAGLMLIVLALAHIVGSIRRAWKARKARNGTPVEYEDAEDEMENA